MTNDIEFNLILNNYIEEMKNMEKKIIEFKDLLSGMSYFNAAEKDWFKETKDRNKCRKRLQTVAKELVSNGMKKEDLNQIVEKGNYMVCKLD